MTVAQKLHTRVQKEFVSTSDKVLETQVDDTQRRLHASSDEDGAAEPIAQRRTRGTDNMEIQPRAVTPDDRARGGGGGGGIVAVLKKWKPLKTPKVTASLTLYLLGLFVAFVARPPVTITDEMQNRYFAAMEAADAIDAKPRMEAERALLEAQMETRQAEVWFWWADAESRARVRALRVVEREKLARANEYRRARDAKVKLAKGELGLWSALGVDEVRGVVSVLVYRHLVNIRFNPICLQNPPSSLSPKVLFVCECYDKWHLDLHYLKKTISPIPFDCCATSSRRVLKVRFSVYREQKDRTERPRHCLRSPTSAASSSRRAAATTTPFGSSSVGGAASVHCSWMFYLL